MGSVKGKRIVLGVTGSIACFKAAQLCSTLVQLGAEVDVVLTEAAQQFIAPLTFQSLTRRPVYSDLYDVLPDLSSAHVELGMRADALVVCPTSATTLARLARGSAEDMLSCTALASTAPLVIAPAMNVNMWSHPATQANVALLRERGAIQVGPVEGRLAEGISGMGRLAPLEDVIAGIRVALGRPGALAGRRVVVSAGGTQEPIDPVRYVGNRSSGKMGYAIAEAARDRGAQVSLVSGPSALAAPWGVEVRRVETAMQMRDALVETVNGADVLVMAAAVADFRPDDPAEHKIKKTDADLSLRLVRNVDFSGDIARQGGPALVKVYFAAETRDLVTYGEQKLRRLQADLLVANDVTEPGSGFGTDTNRVILLGRDGSRQDLPLLTKDEVAEQILNRVERLLSGQS
ncbi:MAG: Phosphopantothenoylcysteine decarboxylase / Phosphopantothenoylcysteine synthetase [uncultured Chloroflexi bacterium]|uniref:Coenzyme A biosynthesis bifunctional protein CoaBC n=1 Tax=uncultured Chloroflexota bacterium TaxID=166587 RepID=A0A6J4IDX9_9CHLR|nr:MAG: Phosphopantothenoylcysteine decarboxylase / Phosphopantothenoylcysteine synthetase [uncultured Chloroflexota bacterium]